ncbi:hypothetical protein PM165_23290, partial [Escherichia coli]|nr:hypothetical protein [Escherichia coli]
VSIKNDGHYFCRAGGNRPDGLNESVTSLCVLAPVLCTPRKLAEVSREIIVASAQEIAWTPGSSRIDGHQGENITWSLSSQSPADKYDLINKTSRVSPDSGRFYEPDTVLDHRERVRLFIQIQFPHGSDWSEVLRLTDIVTEKVSSGRAAGGYHHRHTGYTWSVSHIILFCPVPDFPGVSS